MSASRNFLIGIVALAIPLIAELISPETGAGFDALVYWPFDFAYTLLVGVVFLVSNVYASGGNSFAVPISVGLGFWLGWFVLTLLAVVQLHLSLGYKL